MSFFYVILQPDLFYFQGRVDVCVCVCVCVSVTYNKICVCVYLCYTTSYKKIFGDCQGNIMKKTFIFSSVMLVVYHKGTRRLIVLD